MLALQAIALRRAAWAIGLCMRWLRWLFLASLAAGLLTMSGWAPYPFGILLAVCSLGWFLLETLYHWLALGALSRSDTPLFPRYRALERDDYWPTESRAIRLREQIRAARFRRVETLEANLDAELKLRMVVFESPDCTVRLHVLFLPTEALHASTSLALQSIDGEGQRLITDNVHLPFGGFYPDSWSVERRPWTRGLGPLLRRHEARRQALDGAWAPFEESPLLWLNADQQHLEQFNRRMGFLSDDLASPAGRITAAGRYRLWQELWRLRYLGLPLRYA